MTFVDSLLKRLKNHRPPVKLRKPGLLWIRNNVLNNDDFCSWLHLGKKKDVRLESDDLYVFTTMDFEFCKFYQEPEEWV